MTKTQQLEQIAKPFGCRVEYRFGGKDSGWFLIKGKKHEVFIGLNFKTARDWLNHGVHVLNHKIMSGEFVGSLLLLNFAKPLPSLVGCEIENKTLRYRELNGIAEQMMKLYFDSEDRGRLWDENPHINIRTRVIDEHVETAISPSEFDRLNLLIKVHKEPVSSINPFIQEAEDSCLGNKDQMLGCLAANLSIERERNKKFLIEIHERISDLLTELKESDMGVEEEIHHFIDEIEELLNKIVESPSMGVG